MKFAIVTGRIVQYVDGGKVLEPIMFHCSFCKNLVNYEYRNSAS